MKNLLVTSVQRYSLHDGPGIRTTVFFAGCPLACPWCHNPECILYEPTILIDTEKCTHCGACAKACPTGAALMEKQRPMYDRTRCTACAQCVEQCPGAARAVSAKPYTAEELVSLILRDLPFYKESGGGVTLSGGEVMAQDLGAVNELLETLYHSGISVNIDTCGYAPEDRFVSALPWTDMFLYDMKAFDPELHKRLTGQDNALILSNLKVLSDAGANLDLRIPIIGGANDGLADWEAAADWLLHSVRLAAIHLLPYHNTGIGKYPRLGRDMCPYTVPGPETLETIGDVFRLRGFPSPVIGG